MRVYIVKVASYIKQGKPPQEAYGYSLEHTVGRVGLVPAVCARRRETEAVREVRGVRQERPRRRPAAAAAQDHDGVGKGARAGRVREGGCPVQVRVLGPQIFVFLSKYVWD